MSISSVASTNGAWSRWQDDVVIAIRREFRELFSSVHHNDFDWDAWRPLFDEGYPALTAVQHALSSPSVTAGPGAPH
jgi:hypothetical protein